MAVATARPAPGTLKAVATYNAAADHFDSPPLAFWDRHGRCAVELLGLEPGDRVLDVGCGTGASALPAARIVGNRGSVLGIDVAARLLALARHKAAREGLANVRFECIDMTTAAFPDESFDAVVCVFSIFFTEETHRLVRALWRAIRPGGRLLVTTWGPSAFEPCEPLFTEAISRMRPGRPNAPRPWERVCDPDSLERLFRQGGAGIPRIVSVPDRQRFAGPDDWWVIALGSGYRWEIEQLDPDDRVRLRGALRKRVSRRGITAIDTSAMHAIAVKDR